MLQEIYFLIVTIYITKFENIYVQMYPYYIGGGISVEVKYIYIYIYYKYNKNNA